MRILVVAISAHTTLELQFEVPPRCDLVIADEVEFTFVCLPIGHEVLLQRLPLAETRGRAAMPTATVS